MVRGREMVLRCQTYSEAFEWARLGCESYNVLDVKIETTDDDRDEVPTFLRPPK